ncbi:hypothetical protein [Rasiella sp. SM2506]|uniref:hypothetical protein n=1 Tax=Rasiella sp. SM2506 TaxID=3423914 RepID=UPI003D7B4B2F
MIKFFRHFRQRYISEGKTTKYFKYAIGEIILVMVGILFDAASKQLEQQQSRPKPRAKIP